MPSGAGSSVISQTGTVEGWRWGEFGSAAGAGAGGIGGQGCAGLVGGTPGDNGWRLRQRGCNRRDAAGAGGERAHGGQLAVVGQHPDRWPTRRERTVAAYSQGGAGAAGKSAAGLAATELCLPALTAQPASHYSPTLGVYSTQSGPNAWAMLGTLALGQEVAPPAVAGLRGQALGRRRLGVGAGLGSRHQRDLTGRAGAAGRRANP